MTWPKPEAQSNRRRLRLFPHTLRQEVAITVFLAGNSALAIAFREADFSVPGRNSMCRAWAPSSRWDRPAPGDSNPRFHRRLDPGRHSVGAPAIWNIPSLPWLQTWQPVSVACGSSPQ